MNTMTDALKRAACAAIDAQAQRLTAFGRDILAHPELGYKETRTAGKVLEAFASLGLTDVTRPARTGVKGWLWARARGRGWPLSGSWTRCSAPAIRLRTKPQGAAHACGAQRPACLHAGLRCGPAGRGGQPCGSVCLLRPPAEEYVEIGCGPGLRRAGEVQYLGG